MQTLLKSQHYLLKHSRFHINS